MDGIAVINGKVVALEQATLPVTDVQVTHGLGVYETLDPRFDMAPNLARLAESAAAIGLAPPDERVLRAEVALLVAHSDGPIWVRINLTGDGRRIVWASPFEAARRHVGVTCARAPHIDHPLLAGSVKHRSRGPWVVALRQKGVDELLFVDEAGRFTEGTSCAVLAVIDGAVWTAPWDGRILPSTTLDRLLSHADVLSIPVVRRGPMASGPWQALYIASTTRSLSPVLHLDGTALAGWDPVGLRLAAADDAALSEAVEK